MATDYGLDYLDQKKWIRRSPEEVARLLELRTKQGSAGGGEESYQKWMRALQYAGSAYKEARKRSAGIYHDEVELTQDLLIHMYEVDARRSTMQKEANRLATNRSEERSKLVMFGTSDEELEKVLSTDEGESAVKGAWTTWYLKACLLTGKALPVARIHKTASYDQIFEVADLGWPALDDRVQLEIEAVKNEKYKEALIALTEGHVADHDNRSAAVRQSRALEVLVKILNGVWSGI